MLDLVIRNGLIVDGSGLPGRHGDVAIHDGRIVSVGGTRRRRAPGARRHRQGRGARVHRPAHALRRPALLRPVRVPGDRARRHHRRRRQLLAVARSAARRPTRRVQPHVPTDRGDARGRVRFRRRLALGRGLRRAGSTRSPGNIALNVAPLVGHSVLRMYVMGADAQSRIATRDEISAMADLLRTCLDAGARRAVDQLRRHRRDLPSGAQPMGRRRRARRAVGRARRAQRRAPDRARVLRRRHHHRPRRAARRPVAAPRHHHDVLAAVPLRRRPPRRRQGDGGRRGAPVPRAPRCGRRCRPARSTSASRSTSAA